MAIEMNRRHFLAGAFAAGALGAGASLLGCSPKETPPQNQSDEAWGASDEWLGDAPSIQDEDCIETLDTHVLVVGAGMSGYFAACAAAENNAEVILVEKGSSGVGIRCSAIGAVDSRLQKELGVTIDKMDIANDFTHYSRNHTSMDLINLWADNSGEALDWYCSKVEPAGLFVELEWNMPPEKTRYNMWPVGHGTVLNLNTPGYLGGASEVEGRIQEAILDYYESCGGTALFDTAMQRLIQDEEGSVTGIYATNSEGKYIRINASAGVVLATGGYAYNESMMNALQPEFKKSLAGLFAFPNAAGDGIKAALWAGAQLEGNPANVLFGRGAIPPSSDIGNPYQDVESEYFSFAEQPFLKVGISGERLCNESAPYLFVMNAAAQKNPVHPCWFQIWDSNWASDVERFHTIACSTLIMREGGNHDPDEFMSIEVVAEHIDELVDRGYIIKADTLEDLAAQLLIEDPKVFLETVNRYNELYDKQEDSDFGKEAFRLSGIRTAPFYGVKLGGQELATLHGVRVDNELRVLGKDNAPIPGLYAIGNDQGGMFADIYPNFAAGVNAGRCATFGRLVGKALSS